MALTLPKLALPKLALNKKRMLIIAAVVALLIAGWLMWSFLSEEAPPPPPPPAKSSAGAKSGAAAKAAPLSGPAQDKLIEDVLVASGLKQQLNQLPGQMIAGIREFSHSKTKKMPPNFANTLEQAVADSFAGQDFQNRLKVDLKKNFDQRRLKAVLDELSTPAGKRMVELELAAPARDELDRFTRALAKTPLPAQRLLLIKRIDAAKKASELAVQISFIYIDEIASAMAGEGAKTPPAVAKSIEAQRASATGDIRNATWQNLAFSYRSASDADLETYAKLAESDAAKWLTGIVVASLLEQLKSAAALAGDRVTVAASKPAAAAARPVRSKSRTDARACLNLATNSAIIKCAQEYF